MKMVEIRHRWTNACIWSGEIQDQGSDAKNLGAAVIAAKKAGASLDGANLVGASLDGGEKLLSNGIRMIGPIGSRSSYCTAYATDKGLRFRAGCFFVAANQFREKIQASHGSNDHAADYLAWIAMSEAWFDRLRAASNV